MKYVKIELPDEFYCGCCSECPFYYEEDYYSEEDGWDFNPKCCLGFNWNECLLDIKEE